MFCFYKKKKGGGGGGGGETTYVIHGREKDNRVCEKGPFKSTSCCRFPLFCSDKNQDRLREGNKKQCIYIGKLDV